MLPSDEANNLPDRCALNLALGTEVEITNHRGQEFIQASIEVWADQPGFDVEVAKIIADGKARLEADKFVTDTGTNPPKGIEIALDGTATEVTPSWDI